MKKIFLFMLAIFCSNPARSQVIDISNFIAQCDAFVKEYNKDGGRVVSVSYKDWQGNSRLVPVTTTVPANSCVNMAQTYALRVIKSVGAAASFDFSFIDNGNGSLTTSLWTTDCEALDSSYIKILKDAGWSVDETVRNAVDRMYKNSYCPALIEGIKQQIYAVSKAVAG